MVEPDDEPDGVAHRDQLRARVRPALGPPRPRWLVVAGRARGRRSLLAALLVGVRGGGIENDLADASRTALEGAGLAEVAVSLDGRDATVGPPDGADPSADDLERARGLVAEVPGVRAAEVDAERIGSAAMLRLFGQLWFLLLMSFLAGAVVTWLVAKVALPHEDELEAEIGTTAGGLFS